MKKTLTAPRRLLAPIFLVVLWQAASSAGLISPQTVPAPAQILESLWQITLSGELLRHLAVSLGRVGLGMLIGVGLGTALALIAGLSRAGEDTVDATLQMIRTLPNLALAPLFIIWFGIGETPKIALVALGALFPIYLNLFSGIRSVDKKIIEAGQTLGLTRTEMVFQIVLPGALPSFLVGLRFALGIGWLSLVVGEQINASSGIGYLAMSARDFMRTDLIFVSLILYALLGFGADYLVRILERRLLAWRPSFIEA